MYATQTSSCYMFIIYWITLSLYHCLSFRAVPSPRHLSILALVVFFGLYIMALNMSNPLEVMSTYSSILNNEYNW